MMPVLHFHVSNAYATAAFQWTREPVFTVNTSSKSVPSAQCTPVFRSRCAWKEKSAPKTNMAERSLRSRLCSSNDNAVWHG